MESETQQTNKQANKQKFRVIYDLSVTRSRVFSEITVATTGNILRIRLFSRYVFAILISTPKPLSAQA